MDLKKYRLKVALIGCGRISNKHISAIRDLYDDIKLVAVCDPLIDKLKNTNKTLSEELTKANQAKDPINIFSNYDTLLKEIELGNLKLDLIILCTPSGYHAEQSIKAGKLGVNVCTEKPLATTLKDGIKLKDFFEKSNLNLFIVLQNRLNPTIQLLKKQIDSGRFGKLFLITSNVFWQRPQYYYDQAKWRGTKKLDGGAMLNQSSHYVDLMCYLPNQKVKKISSFANTLGRNIEMEDTAVLNLEYENGAVGNLSLTMLTYPKNIEGSITLLGENGTVKVGGIALNKIEIWDFENDHEDDKLINEVNYETKSVYGSGHFSFYKEIIDILKNKKSNSFSYKQGLLSLEVIMSAYNSIKENKFIYL